MKSEIIETYQKTYSRFGIIPTIRLFLLWCVLMPYRFKRLFDEFRLSKQLNTNYMNIQSSKMKLELSDKGISSDLLINGIREPFLTKWIQEHTNKNDIVIDIGANIGYYTLQFAQIAKYVYAVEPSPWNYEKLYHHVQFNGYKNVKCIRAAIADKSSEKELCIHGSSNLSTINPVAGVKYQDKVPVKCWSLDDIIMKNDFGVNPTMIRMDVEGYETEIIKGATKLLRSKTPLTVIMELHGFVIPDKDYKVMLLSLMEHGFKPVAAFSEPNSYIQGQTLAQTIYKLIQGTSGVKIGYNEVDYKKLFYKKAYREQMNCLQVIFCNR